MAASLAPELKFAVISCLQSDYTDGDHGTQPAETLAALSLVCRSWQGPAQSSLFRNLRLRLTETKTITQFTAFLSLEASPSIKSYILQLQLSNRCGKEYRTDVSTLLSLIDVVPNVRALVMYSIMVTGPLAVPADVPNTKSISKLSLSNMLFDEIAYHILLTRLATTELILDRCFLQLPSDAVRSPPFPLSALSSLRTLHLDDINPKRRPYADAALLKSFGCRIVFTEEEKRKPVIDFLETQGQRIEDLRLDLSYSTGWEGYVQNVYNVFIRDCVGADGFGGLDPTWTTTSLSVSCPSLTTLTLVLYVAVESPDDFKRTPVIIQWRYALCLLASSPPSLTSITLGLRIPGDGAKELEHSTVYTVDWKKWVDVLRGFKQLVELRLVDMDIKWVEGYEEIYEPHGRLQDRFVTMLWPFIRKELEGLGQVGVRVHYI